MYGRDAMATHPRETERLINSPQKKHGPVELGGAGAAVEHRHDRPSRCRRRATFFGPTGKQARLMCVAIGIVIIISAASFAWMIKRSLDEELLPTTTLPQKQSSVLEATVIQPPQHEAAVVGTVIDSEGEEVNTETTTEGKESGVPPNVIFILLDDMGMNDFGFRSTDLMEMTPYIDGLAEKGVRLDNYYTNHICTPARASLMTGRDSFLTGMQFQELSGPEPWGLPLDEATLGNRFQAAGYATHMVGKWNLGMFSEAYYPFNRGFETYLGFLGARETYFTHKLGVYKDYGYGDADGYVDDTTNTTRWGPELEGYYSTNITAERAIQVVEEHMAERETTGVETPLFLYLAFQAAHGPLETPPKDMFTDEQWEVLNTISREDELRQKFAKIVYFLDITLRLMFERFDQVGVLEDTLVVIASDNGGCPSSGGNNMPFRGFKWTLFEGGVRAPAIVWSKSDSIVPKEARGTIYTGMMHAIDWTPTLANLTGIPTEGMGKPLSGLDHWEAIIGKRPTSDPPVRNELVLGRSAYEYDSDSDSMKLLQAPRGAYIYDGWKIVHGDRAAGWFSFTPDDEVPECTVCTSIACEYYPYLNRTFLFHLEEDPLEIVDLGHAMPDKVEEMLDRWNIACQDEVVPNYKARDGNAFDTWKAFNDWIVAWK